MKILFISDQFYPRTSADSEQIISSLSSLGKKHKVTFLSAKKPFTSPPNKNKLSEYYNKEITFGLDFINLQIPILRGIEKTLFGLISTFNIIRKKPDLIYTRNLPVVFFCFFFTSIPIVIESFRPWPRRNIQANWFFKKLAKSSQVLGMILHSNFAKESFLEVGFRESELLVAHNAFDLNDYNNVEAEEAIRKKYNIPLGKTVVTYSGRISKKKGIERMLDLAKEFPEVIFLLVGSENEGEIEKKGRGITNVLIFGWMDKAEVFGILTASDILYIPPSLKARDVSMNTVLPLKTFIYKASGTAIFGPAAEDIKEVLKHNTNAYLVEPDNFNEEVKGLRVLINDKSLRLGLGSEAKKEMVSLTWDSRAQKVSEFIQSKFHHYMLKNSKLKQD